MSNHQVQIHIHSDLRRHKISKFLYSGFAEHFGRCIYDGIWVGKDSDIKNDGGFRTDVIEALSKIALPAVRWPGGNFAEHYHWMDGIGGPDQRVRRYNIEWGQPEPNTFGTHEFMRFCSMIGSEPYLVLNLASGTVQEAREWVEYCNSQHDSDIVRWRIRNGQKEPWMVRFWDIGNENWHSGGQMRPDDYVAAYRRYSNKLRMIGTGDRDKVSFVKLIACGSCLKYQDWDDLFFQKMQEMPNMLHMVDMISDHVYCGRNLTDSDFHDEDYNNLMKELDVLERELYRAVGLAKKYSTPQHMIKIALGEWGVWYKNVWIQNGFFQHNTLRDALFAAKAFHLFHNLGDELNMANMAQMVNAMQCLIHTYGSLAVRTPTYHVFDLYRPHRENDLLDIRVIQDDMYDTQQKEYNDCEPLSVSATINKESSIVFVSLINTDLHQTLCINIKIKGSYQATHAVARQLTAGSVSDENSNKEPDLIKPETLPVIMSQDHIRFILKPKSIVALEIAGQGIPRSDSSDSHIDHQAALQRSLIDAG